MAVDKVRPDTFRQEAAVKMIAKEFRERMMYAVCVKMTCAPFDIVDALATPVEDRNTVQHGLLYEYDALCSALGLELLKCKCVYKCIRRLTVLKNAAILLFRTQWITKTKPKGERLAFNAVTRSKAVKSS